jgi:hypothetical protein
MKKAGLPAGLSPRLLTRSQAAAYCQVSDAIFTARCPVAPVKMGESVRMYRWDIRELDRWLDGLGTAKPLDGQEWLDQLGKSDEDRGARR